MKMRMGGPDDLRALFQHLEKGTDDTVSTPIGTLPPHLVKEYKELARKKDRLEREMDNRISELALIMKNTVENEFGDRRYETEELHDQVWAKVYDYFGLDPDQSYSIDRRTNKVSMEGVPKNNSPYTH